MTSILTLFNRTDFSEVLKHKLSDDSVGRNVHINARADFHAKVLVSIATRCTEIGSSFEVFDFSKQPVLCLDEFKQILQSIKCNERLQNFTIPEIAFSNLTVREIACFRLLGFVARFHMHSPIQNISVLCSYGFNNDNDWVNKAITNVMRHNRMCLGGVVQVSDSLNETLENGLFSQGFNSIINIQN